MDFNDLSEDLKAKAKACKTPDELLQLAKDEGIELSDDQLEQMSGGLVWECPTRHCNPLVNCIGVEPICDDKG